MSVCFPRGLPFSQTILGIAPQIWRDSKGYFFISDLKLQHCLKKNGEWHTGFCGILTSWIAFETEEEAARFIRQLIVSQN